jgi:hypothetical protein
LGAESSNLREGRVLRLNDEWLLKFGIKTLKTYCSINSPELFEQVQIGWLDSVLLKINKAKKPPFGNNS